MLRSQERSRDMHRTSLRLRIQKEKGAPCSTWSVEALPQDARIERATLEVSLTGPVAEKSLTLQIHPITTPWDPGIVNWESGWEKPGGDFDSGAYTRSEVDLSKGSATFGIDLTGLMKEILEDGRAANGFIVTVPSYAGEGIASSDLDWLAGFSSATLDLSYRIYSRPPPWLSQDTN